jgi:hypothetical protein
LLVTFGIGVNKKHAACIAKKIKNMRPGALCLGLEPKNKDAWMMEPTVDCRPAKSKLKYLAQIIPFNLSHSSNAA